MNRKAETVYPGNTHIIELTDLTDGATSDFIVDATIEGWLYDARGNLIAGQSFPTEFEYLDDGNYRGILAHTLEIGDLKKGYLHIIITAGETRVGDFKIPIEFKDRRYCD